jgi:hypothetical protein
MVQTSEVRDGHDVRIGECMSDEEIFAMSQLTDKEIIQGSRAARALRLVTTCFPRALRGHWEGPPPPQGNHLD